MYSIEHHNMKQRKNKKATTTYFVLNTRNLEAATNHRYARTQDFKLKLDMPQKYDRLISCKKKTGRSTTSKVTSQLLQTTNTLERMNELNVSMPQPYE